MQSSTHNFTVYNSSAGTGKTFTLVKEYLKIALKTDNEKAYKHILAITFTNKAAAEMKQRVIDALKAISGKNKLEGTPLNLQNSLLSPIKDGGIEISEELLKKRSEKVLRSILHNYNDFAISTIDKFTTKIIRTFTLDLKLPLNFGIELNESEVIKNAIDLLIDEIGTHEKLTKLLLDYSKEKADEEKNFNIENELYAFAKNIVKDGGEAQLEKIRNLSFEDFERIKKEMTAFCNSFKKEVATIGKNAIQFIQSKGIQKESFYSSYVYIYFNNLIVFTSEKLTPNKSVTGMFNGEKDWYSKKIEQSQKDLIDTYSTEITEFYNSLKIYLNENLSKFILCDAALKTLTQTAIINEIEKTISQFKSDNNILNLSDFNKQISKIILSESIPFIYERLGEKYHHFLIDEFQDTSIVQWQNIIPLIDNSLSNGNYNMLVGDAKQAIYRFRGGEVEQIINLPYIYQHNNNKYLVEREKALIRNHKDENLSKNFRSKAEIVDFNNRFFNFVSQKLSPTFSPIYKDLNQQYDPNNTGGGISFTFLEKEDYESQTLNQIFETIKLCVTDNYKLSDIAVITWSNDKASDIASFLLQKEIAVISSESLLLNNSAEVKFILHLLKYITNSSDISNQLYIINYLINNRFTNEENIEYFKNNPKNALHNFLEKHQLNFNFSEISLLSLLELTEYLISHFQLRQKENIFISFFIDKVHQYSTTNNHSIAAFIEWWDLKSEKFSVVIPSGIDAVQVNTIHKSKGLEFPIVIYPYASTTQNSADSQLMWTNISLAEGFDTSLVAAKNSLLETEIKHLYEYEKNKKTIDLINVVYVAMTRPVNRLYIISKNPIQKPSKLNKNNEVQNSDSKNYFYDYCESVYPEIKDSPTCQFGKFIPKKIDSNEKVTENYIMNVSPNFPWRNRISISYQVPKYWEIDTPKSSSEFGNIIHQLLSEVNHFSDIDNCIRNFDFKGVFNQKEKVQLIDELKNLLEKPEIKFFFSDFSFLKNENTILTPEGKSYKPDRVIIKNQVTHILDYKTGKHENKHIEQLLQYKEVLQRMGYNNINCYLLYVTEQELKKVG